MRIPSERSRPLRRTLTLLVATLLVSGSGAAYLRQAPTEVSVDDAVAAFRSTTDGRSTPTANGEGDVAPADGRVPLTPEGNARVATTTSAAPAAPTPSPAAAPAARAPAPNRTSAAAAATAPGPTPTTAAPPPAGGEAELEEGVYTFATEGYEATNALGGARHDYPKETPVTMRRSECGWTQRWQPLDERWDESALCRTEAGMDVHRFTTYHEFFQKGQQQQFDCPPGSSVHRRDAPAGATWSWRCTAGSSAIDTVVTVAGPEPVVVEGEEIPAVRVHYESKLSGGNRGTQIQDRWIRADGLNLRIKTDIDTQADSPFGDVHYEEHYVITIASLTPRR